MNFFKNLFARKKKVFILGIDGAPPQLVFNEWLNYLPNIKELLNHSLYGEMESTVPPSTIVAWTSMLTGKDPSFFDVYSYTFKNEDNETKLTNSLNVKEKRLWNRLDKLGRRSIVLNVPLTYPVEPINGIMISDFLTPEFNDQSVYPLSMKQKIKDTYKKDYIFDVAVGLAGYKTLDTEQMIQKVYEMTDLQLSVAFDLIKQEKWDFFMTVLIGSDRMQHTMWRFFDQTHRRHPGKTEYETAIRDYYIYLDKKIGELRQMLDEDTYFIIASDHGFDKMEGRINLNDWLIKEGYLVLREKPISPRRLDFSKVNWQKTKAYAIGAYFGRIYFNRKARDPVNGILEEEEVAGLQQELIDKLKLLPDDHAHTMGNIFYKPQEVYAGPYLEESPDLYVYFDTLRWGVNNDVGNNGLYSQETTKGSDDAGHAPVGLFLLHHSSLTGKRLERLNIIDVLPTVYTLMGMEVPKDLKGRVLLKE